MSNNKKKNCKKILLKLNEKNLELPLKIGFKRLIVRKEHRLIAVYYLTPDRKYLKDISEVCDWISEDKQCLLLSQGNFNFITRKFTSNNNEYIIDYDTLPLDVRENVVQRKRTIAPVIMTMTNDDNGLSMEAASVSEIESDIPNKPKKIRIASIKCDDALMELNITNINSKSVNEPQKETTVSTNYILSGVEQTQKKAEMNGNQKEDTDVFLVTKSESMEIAREPEGNMDEMKSDMESIIFEDIPQNLTEIEHLLSNSDDKKSEMGVDSTGCESLDPRKLVSDEQGEGEYNKVIQAEYGVDLNSDNKFTESESHNKSPLEKGYLLPGSRNSSGICEVDIIDPMSPPKSDPSKGTDVIPHVYKEIQAIISSETTSGKGEELPLDSNDESMTLSIESVCADEAAEVVLKPRNPFEYPLATVNMNSVMEIGISCHVSRVQEILNGESDLKILKLMKSYCGTQCAFDLSGNPRIAFECDICLVLWHTECTGYRWMDIGPTSLMICDNCYTLQQTFNLEVPNTFCNIDKLLQAEFKPEPNTQSNGISIPLKLESIFKLCKTNWILQNLKLSKNKNSAPETVKVIRKLPKKEILKDIPKKCRYFIKVYIGVANIIRNLSEECIIIKYSMGDIERMATIFADGTCKIFIHGNTHDVFGFKLTVKDGELIIPISGHIRKPGNALFYTVDDGQDLDRKYIARYESLKSTMFKIFKIPKLINQGIEKPIHPGSSLKTTSSTLSFPTNTIPCLSIPIKNQIKVIPSGGLMMSPQVNTIIPSFSSKNLPKNVIPIPRNQIQNFTNILKIRKRKQEFSSQRVSALTTFPPRIPSYNLVNLPFCILEKILTTRNLTTTDLLNCRLANRILRSVVDAGRVWTKVVINTALVTGLQTMFHFFSQRSVRKITFVIDCDEEGTHGGSELFSSFINRLKLYPECFLLEKISLKLMGFNKLRSEFQVTIQDMLSSIKCLRTLSICSNEPLVLAPNKYPYLTSESLEKLKLRNVENVGSILQVNEEFTPKLRIIHCGDLSRITALDMLSFSQVTSLTLEFSDSVGPSDVSTFSRLSSLQRIVIARPQINVALKTFLSNILSLSSVCYLRLETEATSKTQLLLCRQFGTTFPPHVAHIWWSIYVDTFTMLSEFNFKQRLMEMMPHNVSVSVYDV